MVRFPWSWGSPVGLAFALVLFALPWIDVRCDRPLDSSGTRTLVTQSGLQAAYGGYTEGVTLQNRRATMRAQASNEQAGDSVSWAPLMVLFGLCLVAGIVCGFVARRPLVRLLGLVGSSALALVLLYLQAQRGFPLEEAVNRPAIRDATAGGLLRAMLGGSGLLEVRYTPWFWLTVAVVLAALLAAAVEGLVGARRGRVAGAASSYWSGRG